MDDQLPNARRARRVIVDPYEVDVRLAELRMSRRFLEDCAWRGQIARNARPPFDREGVSESDANSTIESAMVELGGTTEGGWQKGRHLNIPVVFSGDGLIAVHATTGTDGTGRIDGEPTNKSIKGPATTQVTDSAQIAMTFDIDQPVEFYYFLTCPDPEGLWAELYAPLDLVDGHVTDFMERIILGNLGPSSDPERLGRPVEPNAPVAPEITITRKTG